LTQWRSGVRVIFGLLEQLQALGLDIPTILAQLGVNAGKQTEAVAKPVEPKAGKPLT
jgi:hypothetical protein